MSLAGDIWQTTIGGKAYNPMSERSLLTLIFSTFLLLGFCSSEGVVFAEGEAFLAEGDEGQVAEEVPVEPPVDDEVIAMVKRLGMTVAELQMKKQMMMDSGVTPEEIAKVLAMNGDPASLFKDGARSNIEPPKELKDLVFFRNDKDQQVKIKDYIGKFHLVLVFTRGYSGGTICPFCTMQTAQLAASHQKFLDRDARVIIIYPGSKKYLPDFAAAVTNVDREQADIAAVKWPVVLDPDLKAVNLLDIAADLAKPSTFIIDKQGNVVFAYVGANRTDRPSVKALLEQLDAN